MFRRPNEFVPIETSTTLQSSRRLDFRHLRSVDVAFKDSPCWVYSKVFRCSYCIRMHLSCSLASNKRFDAVCQDSLAREISNARRRLQADVTLLNDLERRWEYPLEYGFPPDTFFVLGTDRGCGTSVHLSPSGTQEWDLKSLKSISRCILHI
jgi:hypothetical protein